MRSFLDRRTHMSTNEVNDFLDRANATFAMVKLTLNGRSGYYFMWIDGDKPYFKLQYADILVRLVQRKIQATANTNNYRSL